MQADIEGLETIVASRFATGVVTWQKQHGRNHLPWQNTSDPYRVWLSEIMLQQTQVGTVLDYYKRFLQRFPGVAELAAAHEDEVLALWSGLGYYSRARNLYRCAQQVVAQHGGQFPRSASELQTLPGIGPSTAAAIASFCFAERVAIFDGNVKRVLARVLAFSGDLAESGPQKKLLAFAVELLPQDDQRDLMPRYTQGLMDLGATVCTLRSPRCGQCPIQALCCGYAKGEPEKYPVKTRKLKRSAQSLSLLWAKLPDGSVWLERRPGIGIWGGLYCLPVFDSEDALTAFLPRHLQEHLQFLASFVHVLTHRDLHLTPVVAEFSQADEMPGGLTQTQAVSDARPYGAWFAPDVWSTLGLPAPIRKLLLQGPNQS